MDIKDINSTIHELENGSTTFDSCIKLASLYTVRDHFKPVDTVVSEYGDILPEYMTYKSVKRKYQLGEIPKVQVVSELNMLCKEIKEFLHILYSNSDMPEERETLKQMLNDIITIIK